MSSGGPVSRGASQEQKPRPGGEAGGAGPLPRRRQDAGRCGHGTEILWGPAKVICSASLTSPKAALTSRNVMQGMYVR